MNSKNKIKTFIFSFIIIFLISIILSDHFLYRHERVTPFAKKITSLIEGGFATVGIVGTSTNPFSTTTPVIKRILPPESPTDYTDNGDGTITDNYTNLIWAKCTQGINGKDCSLGSPSLRDWNSAKKDCGSLNLAGKTNWRLPTLKELQSIVDTGTTDGSINKKFFPNSTNNPYWTSTSPAQYSASKFTVLFSDGSVYFKGDNNFAAARCVFSGN